MKATEIRHRFADYFKRQGHQKHESSPLVPQNDPTLLFANAGMNQFKDYFTGKAKPIEHRAVTIQKCVRAGGKHNDLENVGFTARHHTFFEMLGNFSFGDYFKDDAIKFAWEFLTKELSIPPEKLFVTVHYSDDEALNIWHKKIGLPLDRIFKKGDKDNFWEMGEFGPCGPCSEIYFDHGPSFARAGFVPKEGQDILDDDLRYVEIWNLVFMQFEKTKEGTQKLPKPSIDTGAGLERIAAALQGKYYNYDTDIFAPIISDIEKVSGKKYTDPKYTSSMRVVADHIRACTMLITDGAIPSNEGRGYVLRRIIRRAVRHLKELGAPPLSFTKLVPIVLQTLGEEYPQNKTNQALAEKLLALEEKKFLETLDIGLKFLNEAITKDVVNSCLSGDAAFKLYDTYGFPLDLTEIILKERGLFVDSDGFNKTMSKRKEESKKSWKGGEGVDQKIFHELKNRYGTTTFVGYEKESVMAKLLAIAELPEEKALIFDTTTFYGESGGQLGDTGKILEAGLTLAHITDTIKPVEGLFVHLSKDCDALEVGKEYLLEIDTKRRDLIKRNHSATHLLQSALISVLGPHVKQSGSSVGPDKLRFDFTHTQAVTKEELKEVERIVNQKISEALPVTAQVMDKDSAIKKGAQALFGEKYGDKVRVLEMGKFSLELCGGTHVHNVSEIGIFKILSESSLATGIRRIEAQTSLEAIVRLERRSNILEQVEGLVKLREDKIVERLETILKENKEKQKEIDELKAKIQRTESETLFNNPEKMKGIPFMSLSVKAGSDLKMLADLFSDRHPTGIVVLYTSSEGKVSVLVKGNHPNLNCMEILKASLPLLNGRGGGRKDMAQGSGESHKLGEFLIDLRKKIEEKI